MDTENKKIKIALGTDHAGFAYKEKIKSYLQIKGFETQDFGTFSEDSCNYPDFVKPAAQAVANDACDLGIVLGGSGNGEAMAANKVKGVRCAICWSLETARLAKEHNDANVISIGQRQISPELAIEIVQTWLDAKFAGGRHTTRIQMIEE